jgi:chromosome segregation ATPase
MSVYFISGGIVLAHFLYKHNTHITNYIQQKIVDYRVRNLQTNMVNLHDIIDSLEQRLMEKQMECNELSNQNQELKSQMSQLNEKVSDFIGANYEFVDDE